MKKTLKSLVTAGLVGGAVLFGGARDAVADTFYDSGVQNVQKNLHSGGYLGISYRQIIEDVDTTGDDINDTYKSTLTMYNTSQESGGENLSFYKMDIDADLAGRGCENMNNALWNWIYQTTGENSSIMTTNSIGTTWVLQPGDGMDFNYDIKKDDVLGWETVNSEMVSPDGSICFDYQVPVPEPATAGLLVAGGLSAWALRRSKKHYDQ